MEAHMPDAPIDEEKVVTDDKLMPDLSAAEANLGSLKDIENLDDAILQANGHTAAMPRQFRWLSALGLAFSITNSWIGYLVSVLHAVAVSWCHLHN